MTGRLDGENVGRERLARNSLWLGTTCRCFCNHQSTLVTLGAEDLKATRRRGDEALCRRHCCGCRRLYSNDMLILTSSSSAARGASLTKVVHGRSRPDRTADYSRETYGQRDRIPVVIICNRGNIFYLNSSGDCDVCGLSTGILVKHLAVCQRL